MEHTLPDGPAAPQPTAVPGLLLTGGVCTLLCIFFGLAARDDLRLPVKWAALFLLAAGALVFYSFTKQAERPLADAAAVFCGCTAVCICLFVYDRMQYPVFFLVLCGLLLTGLAAVYLAVTKRMDYKKAVLLLLIAGFIVRLGYILVTDISSASVRQHDVYEFGGPSGHAAYIEYYYTHWQLPDFDPRSVWQFYQPPLHHFLAAVWLKLQTLLGIPYDAAVEGLQFLTLFYASAAILLAKRILQLLRLHGQYLLFAVLIVAFSPAFILFSGSVNNDILSILFLFAAVLSALKWYQTDALAHLLQTAVWIGLGMMTKTSVAMVAFPVAVLMLVKWITAKQKLRLTGRYALFGVIVFPLGLWWPVRNFVRFGMPLNYVPKLSETVDQYVGFHTFAERFLPFLGFGGRPTFSWSGTYEYNAWSGLFKSSAFGEFAMGNYSTLAAAFENALFVFTLAVCILSFAAMLYVLITGYKESTTGKWFMAMLYITTLTSYLVFCYRFPHSCTMNIRYASPLILTGAFFTGAAMQKLGTRTGTSGFGKTLRESAGYFTALCICCFAAFSVIVYTLLAIPNA